MAADAAPAAVPDPHDTTGSARTSGAQPGLLASALAPVAPARTAAFTLDPAAANSTEGALAGASSDAFHTSPDTPAAGAKTGTAGGGAARNQSVVKAWLLAGAERWKKGAGANIKRLEVAKARAMAQQVKETRQVSERRVTNPTPAAGGKAPGPGPSGSGKPGSGGKGVGQKSGGAVNGPKNSGGTPRPSGGQGGPSPKGAGTDRPRDTRGKNSGANAPGPAPAKGADKPSRTGASDSTRTPRDGKAPGSGDTKAHSRKDGGSSERKGTGPTAAAGSGAKGSDGKPGKDAGPVPTPKVTNAPKPDPAKTDTGKPSSDTSGSPKAQPGTPQGDTPKPATTDKTPKPADKDKAPKDTTGQTKTGDKTTPPKPAGKPFTTRESRETGYRDGTRAARTVAQVKAYRDGAKDGWTDTLEIADHQKQRLDQAHEQRKTERAQQKEQPVTPAPTSADYHQPQDQAGPQPIPVTGINATHLTLGDGAARDTMTRGEVRTLKHFERSLADKATLADKAAEQTRLLKAHADAQAAKALQLLELARGVKGGDKLSAALTKAHEAAATQAGQAEEVHRRATRAAEVCRTVLINTQTRYGAMYQAVVDSPETTPAEMTFYLGDRNG